MSADDALNPLTVEVTRLSDRVVRLQAALREQREQTWAMRDAWAEQMDAMQERMVAICDERDEAVATLAEARDLLDEWANSGQRYTELVLTEVAAVITRDGAR